MAALLSGPGVAHADPATTTSATDSTSGKSCVLHVESGKMTCYDTAEEARSRAGHWEVALYDGRDLSLPALYLQTKWNKCPKNMPTYGTPDLGRRWNNRISSVHARSGCQVKLFGKKVFKGKRTKWIGGKKRLGRVMNNNTESLKIR